MAEISEKVRDDGVCVVSVTGDLDLATVDQFLKVARRSGVASPALEVDLGGLSFVDSTGLSALIRLRGETSAGGRHLRLTNVGPSTHRLLQVTGLLEVFGIGAEDP